MTSRSPVLGTVSSERSAPAPTCGAACASAADAHAPPTRTAVRIQRSALGETTTSDSRLLQPRRVVQHGRQAEHPGAAEPPLWARCPARRMRGAKHGAFGLWMRVVSHTTRAFLFRWWPKGPGAGPKFSADP